MGGALLEGPSVCWVGECPGWRRVPGKRAGMWRCRNAGVSKAEIRMSKDLRQWGAGLRHPRTRNGKEGRRKERRVFTEF